MRSHRSGPLLPLIAVALAVGTAAHAAPGDLDLSFHGTGMHRVHFGPGDDYTRGIAARADGKLIVAGHCRNGAYQDLYFVRYNTDGTPDVTFGVGGTALFHAGEVAECAAVRLQGDGKIVAAGRVTNGLTGDDFLVVRLNADGSPDPSFGGAGMVVTDITSTSDIATCLRIQFDGKIVVGGASRVSGIFDYDFAVVRYETSGALDTSFSGDGKLLIQMSTDYDQAHGLLIQNDGKILLVGETTRGGSSRRFGLARCTTAGLLDTSFDGDGKVFTTIAGSRDIPRAVAIQPGTTTTPDKIVVTGYAQATPAVLGHIAVARYNLNGSLDTSFDADGKLVTTVGVTSEGHDVAVQLTSLTGRKIVVTGRGDPAASYSNYVTLRYLSDGALDASFGGGGMVTTDLGGTGYEPSSIVLQSGRYLVAGTAYPGTDLDVGVVRLNADGSRDTSFDKDGLRIDNVGSESTLLADALLLPDGRLLGTGSRRQAENLAMQFTDDGALDPAFAGDGSALAGRVTQPGRGARQPDGSVLLAGSYGFGMQTAFVVSRILPNGAADAAFGTGGTLEWLVGAGYDHLAGVAALPDGRILLGGDCDYPDVVGTVSAFALARINANGTRDLTFGNNGAVVTPLGGFDTANALAVQPDGKILLAGRIYRASTGRDEIALARFDATGVLDPTFNGIGLVRTAIGSGNAEIRAIQLLPDGRILVAGDCIGAFDGDFLLARYHADGTLDTGFDGDGLVITAVTPNSPDHATCLAIQPDGRIVVAGSSWNGAQEVCAVLRFYDNGVVDPTYGTNGRAFVDFPGSFADRAAQVLIDSAGRVVLAADAGGEFGVARLRGDNPSAVGPGNPAPPAPGISRVEPNPFRHDARVSYRLEAEAPAILRVFSPEGRLVRTLAEGPSHPGPYVHAWDGTDDQGHPVPSGVYFIHLQQAGAAASRRVVLMR